MTGLGYRVETSEHVGYVNRKVTYSFHDTLNEALTAYNTTVNTNEHADVTLSDLGAPHVRPARIILQALMPH